MLRNNTKKYSAHIKGESIFLKKGRIF